MSAFSTKPITKVLTVSQFGMRRVRRSVNVATRTANTRTNSMPTAGRVKCITGTSIQIGGN